MSCCARVAPALLLHVSLLLTMLSGAGLATSARLKWDPSAYIAARELFPLEYRVGTALLCAASLGLLALCHLAGVALALPPRAARLRRLLLLTYAAVIATLFCVQVACLSWTSFRVAAWLEGAQAEQVAEALAVREHLAPLLQYLARWHPLPARIRELVEEAERDLPRNLHVAVAALALAAALQPAATLLALLSARRSPSCSSRGSLARYNSGSSTENEREPLALRAAYKNGKLVIV